MAVALLFPMIIGIVELAPAQTTAAAPLTIELSDGWKVQAAAKTPQKGEAISTGVFGTNGWYRASVPSTVLAVLADNGVYKNIYYGTNLSKIPTGQFDAPWWYRTEFTIPQAASFASARLVFEGINFRADVFLNGSKIASGDKVFGAYRIIDLDVTTGLKKGRNVLAVKVFPPKTGDFTIGFVDWNPTPPDHNMGLFRPVKIRLSGPVSIESPYVTSRVDTKTLSSAGLTVSAILTNRTDKDVKGTLTGRIDAISFSREYSLKPHESADVVFGPDKFPQLVIKDPKLWWPAGMGKPDLCKLQMSAGDAAGISDSQTVAFGIRQVQDYLNEKGYRGYKINGRNLLIKGGGWGDELLLREDAKNLDAQMRYALHMNLNTIRLEGIWGSSQKLYDLADRYGILLMIGWSCHWEWPEYIGRPMPDTTYGMAKEPVDIDLLASYYHDQVLWLRHHPSIFVFSLGSDKLLWPDMEKRFRSENDKVDPQLLLLASCKGWNSEVSGNTAVKMKGPYDYEPPVYWYIDTARGGAYGFNTETGPGPQPPVLETFKKMIPAGNSWPVNSTWDFHCARNEFSKLDRYMTAFTNRYGQAKNADDFCFRAQAASYEAMRPMFEAFAVNRPVTTGIIQWMFNASWPRFYWQFFDYYLVPTGAFYAARKACQPLSVVYDYGDNGIYLVNQTYSARPGLTTSVSIFTTQSKVVFSKTIKANVAADASVKILDLPAAINGLTPVYFVALALQDSSGSRVADNFYWLSKKPDVIAFQKADWYYTPCSEWADFTPLSKLPSVSITELHTLAVHEKELEFSVTLSNPGKDVAFCIELSIVGDHSHKTIVPVFWDDNYISLVPGETRTLKATFAADDLGSDRPLLQYRGWNVAQQSSSQKGARK